MKHYYCENCGAEMKYPQNYCGGKRDYEVQCHICGIFYGPEALGIEPNYSSEED